MKSNEMLTKATIWAATVNIRYIVGFHEYVLEQLGIKEREIVEKIARHKEKDKELVDLKIERNLYSETYKNNLMVNTFLMLYSHLEEWLYLIWRKFGKNIELKGKRGSISKYKPFFQVVFKMDLSKDKDWNILKDAQKIRNCLLHANGRIDMVKNKAEMSDIIKRYKSQLFIKTKRLCIKQELVEIFFGSIQSVIYKVDKLQKNAQNHR